MQPCPAQHPCQPGRGADVSEMASQSDSDTKPLRDWLVTFAHKVAVERDYSARHPGHVFLVMLHRDEAEGLLAQVNELVQGGGQT